MASVYLLIFRMPTHYLFQFYRVGLTSAASALHIVHPRQPAIEARVQEQFAEVTHLMNRFAMLAKAGDHARHAEGNTDPLQRLGRMLYTQCLPQPIQQTLQSLNADTQLILTTNDTLLPWELLHDGERYLALTCAVTRQLLTDQPVPVPSTTAHGQWRSLLVGNPTGDLPQSSQEVEELSRQLELIPGAARPRLLVRYRATKETLLQELATTVYDLIHYSGHAQFDPNDPTKCGLLLADDELLTLAEIRSHMRGSPVIFLNGCESARTLDTADAAETHNHLGTATEGLAAALIAGNAQSVIGTFWPILDSSSKDFALDFYRSALEGVPLSRALQQVRQRYYIKAADIPIWASYTLFGDAQLPMSALQNYEKRSITTAVLYMRGLPSLHRALGVEAAVDLEKSLLDRLTKGTAHFHGLLVHTTLPTLQWQWGIPTTTENHASVALDCALELQQLCNRFNQEFQQQLTFHIGVSSGLVLTQRSSTATTSWQLSANLVSVATELAIAAPKDTIYLDETTHRQTQIRFAATPVTTDPVFGDANTQQTEAAAPLVYQLLGPQKSEQAVTAVGRGDSLRQLMAWWQPIASQRGRIVGVVGVPGVGKTHLIRAFRQQLDETQAHWLTITCHAHATATQLAVMAQIIRTLASIAVDDTEEQQLTQLTLLIERTLIGLGHPVDEYLTETLALVAQVLGLHIDAPTMTSLGPQLRQKRLVGITQALLHYSATEKPLVLLLDDLQWIDEASLAIIHQLLNGLHQQPILAITIHRPDWTAPWIHLSHYHHLPLGLLQEEAQAALLAELLDEAPYPPELATAILDRTGGNPFFITEVIQALKETNRLIYENAQWHLTEALEQSPLPETVENLVQARMDQLSMVSRAVIQRAAVIGQIFDHQVLAAVQEEPTRQELDQSVSELAERDFIETRYGFTVSYSFRHAIIQETVYQRLLTAVRRSYHRLIADVLRRLHGERDVDRLAYHYDQSGDRVPAIRYALMAARQAAATWANQSAITWYDRAWAKLESFVANSPTEAEIQAGATPEQRYIWCLTTRSERAAVYATIGENELALNDFNAALALGNGTMPAGDRAALLRRKAVAHHDQGELTVAWKTLDEALVVAGEEAPTEVGRILIYRGLIYFRTGAFAEALTASQRGITLFTNNMSQAIQTDLGQAYNLQCILLRRQGEFTEAIAVAQKSIAVYEEAQFLPGLARALSNLGCVYQDTGEWPAAIAANQRSIDLSRRTGDERQLASALLDLGEIYRRQGKTTDAQQRFAEAKAIGEAMAFPDVVGMALINLGAVHIDGGNVVEAKALLYAGTAQFSAIGLTAHQAEIGRYQAQVALAEGKLASARTLAEASWHAAHETNDLFERALATRLLGEISTEEEDWPSAEQQFAASLATLRDQQSYHEIGLTLMAWARLQQRAAQQGDQPAARQAQRITLCDEAVDLFRKIGAEGALARARALRQE